MAAEGAQLELLKAILEMDGGAEALAAHLASAVSGGEAGDSAQTRALVEATLKACDINYRTERDGNTLRLNNDPVVRIRPLKSCGAVMYAYASFKVPEARRRAFGLHLCGVNYGLAVGKFELDMSDGEVRFSVSVNFFEWPNDNAEFQRVFASGLHVTLTTMERHNDAMRAAAATGEGLPRVPDTAQAAEGDVVASLARARSNSGAAGLDPLRLLSSIRAGQSDPDAVLRLIRAGQDVNQTDAKGMTPLMAAAIRNYSAVVKTLLDNGARPGVVSTARNTALSLAVWKRATSSALVLIRAGAPADLVDGCGDTPLIDAAKHGLLDVVTALLDAGANPSRANVKGETALGLALEAGHTSVARVLQQRGG